MNRNEYTANELELRVQEVIEKDIALHVDNTSNK